MCVVTNVMVLQDWPTGKGLLPSISFRHLAGDAMDKKLLDQAEVSNADAIIMGVAHDSNPKDVSSPTFSIICC